ncbi:MAG TPA: hypothetical protein VNJ01_10270 [Bacteriovoracaceae bacterium]|nr:hypothetical protein [Bacteriovoracaceae bacterium]
MSSKRIIPFSISSMDSMGQGVSKETDKITFIAKTMTGDSGEAEILSEKKGVAFAKVTTLTHASPQRIEPVCPHFEVCPSCHYLHIGYEQELLIKKENLQGLLRKLPVPAIDVIPALRRLGYRNRIQLHYDRRERSLGMFDQKKNKIVEVPSCRIGVEAIGAEVRRLYAGQTWLLEAPEHPVTGHVEIYQLEGSLKVTWNRPYAEGGFTQVFKEMNQKLIELLGEELKDPAGILDLFAGNGNLSASLNYSNRLCVDIYQGQTGIGFLNQNLYDPSALKIVKKAIAQIALPVKTLLLDPPRSGFKELGEWLQALRPQTVAYVSCDPHTLARDMMVPSEYNIKKVCLIDFFPSTFHYESVVLLERKK